MFSTDIVYAGGKLIKENVSVLEDSAASQTPAAVAGNVAGMMSGQN